MNQRIFLENNTREQNSEEWHVARKHRITGSKCGRVIQQKTKTVPLLRFCVYPKHMIHLPKAIVWGN